MQFVLTYEDATRISGELFGNLFARDSDKEGFDYAHRALLSREKTPRDLVKSFMSSDEFRELHVMNQTPNEFAKRLLTRVLGVKRVDPEAIKSLAIRLLQEDWRIVISDLIESPEYAAVNGEQVVPLWV